MGVYGGPEIPNDGLVLALDGANYKSFKGEVTTNLIPNPTVNAYPTTGNGWGSYNTNQYNGAQYFSIGSIVSVSGNVITTSGNHPLRTYDVMRAQSTGGGVNAGTDYFIKKVSDTSFTLHEYNGSQDGSQGYINPSTGTHKVYDSIATDTRISVNSTSFPTMWWGAPHLPNSGLVKELRYGEFNAIPNLPANDCIRLHYIRTDGVMDGMSYGVYCTVTPSSPVTVSFYTRAATASAVGKQIQYQIYNYTGGNAAGYAMNFTLGAVGVWERQTFTFTPAYGTMISYWFPVSGGVYAWDWSCMQVEQKSYVTSFVAGTRGTTVATGGGWADLIGNGNHGELVNGVRESSDNLGSLVFDGTNDYVILTRNDFNTSLPNFTISVFVYKISDGIILGNHRHNQTWESVWLSTTEFTVNDANGTANRQSLYHTTPINSWMNLVAVNNSSQNYMKVFLNGAEIATKTATVIPWNSSIIPTIGANLLVGDLSPIGPINGRIANTQIYNRALSAAEISQNFNALRGRFGI